MNIFEKVTANTSVPIDDRALNYGDGVFETIRVQQQHAPLLDWHIRRMTSGLAQLGIRVSSEDVEQLLSQGVRASQGDGLMKVLVSRGSPGLDAPSRGYMPPVIIQPRCFIRYFPLPQRPSALYQDGMVLGVCQQRLADDSSLAGSKHLNRLPQVLAAQEVQAHGWDEGVMLDQLGRPVELTTMNLFARFGDLVWTPSVQRSGVAGVLRSWLLDHWAPTQNITVQIKARPLADLRHADEIFAGNSVAGWVPVRKLAIWRKEVGPMVRSLQNAFVDVFSRS